MKNILLLVISISMLQAEVIFNIFPVGTVIHSVLTEKQYREEVGCDGENLEAFCEWVLMDGRPVSKSDVAPVLDGIADCNNSANNLATNDEICIPDARGQFLRMQASGRSVTDGGDEERLIGSSQKGSTINLGQAARIPYVYTGSHVHYILTVGTAEGDPVKYPGYYNETVVYSVSDSDNIRPRNISLNYFIKISKCKQSLCR